MMIVLLLGMIGLIGYQMYEMNKFENEAEEFCMENNLSYQNGECYFIEGVLMYYVDVDTTGDDYYFKIQA